MWRVTVGSARLALVVRSFRLAVISGLMTIGIAPPSDAPSHPGLVEALTAGQPFGDGTALDRARRSAKVRRTPSETLLYRGASGVETPRVVRSAGVAVDARHVKASTAAPRRGSHREGNTVGTLKDGVSAMDRRGGSFTPGEECLARSC